MAHLEAWDIRRWLTRIFGFGGWAYTTDVELVAEHRKDDHRKRNRDGQEYGPSYTAWTVVYRSKVRLEIRDAHGNELSYFEEYAAGDAVNQPRLGDAHDFALKTAESQALKRAAVNLGDQFGLALYDKGGHIVDHPDTGRKVVRGVVAATLDRFAQQAPDEDPPVQGGELDDMANAA
jgi:recombination DNA repair RAD52 pathway protein